MALEKSVITNIEKVRSHFPTTQALVIPLLHEIQEHAGWISMDAMKDAAKFLELPLSKILEVATFYTMFNLKPVGKVHLQLCANISCHLNGAENIMHTLENHLGIKCGQTTADGKYTLSEVECLASCGTGPVLQVNEDYKEDMTVQKTLDLLKQIESDLKQNKEIGKESKSILN